MTGRASGRRTFGPVVLIGVAAGVLVAVAAAHPWVGYTVKPAALRLVGSDVGEVPLASALAYVLLAAWGVLLVTRGVVRRAFGVVATLTALGLAACAVYAFTGLPADVRGRFPTAGYAVTTDLTGWLWAAVAGIVLSVVATVLAVRWTPTWPEMGRRYDAPGARAVPRAVPRADPDADPDDPAAGNLALWKAIDDGEDPTTAHDAADVPDDGPAGGPDRAGTASHDEARARRGRGRRAR